MSHDVLSSLTAIVENERQNLRRSSLVYNQVVEHSEEAQGNPFRTPIMDSYRELRPNAILTMTNLTDTEFNILWTIIEEDVNEKCHETRGRKNQVSGKDAFFMLLVILEYYSSWDKHALDFKFKTPTFERLITRMMDVVELKS
ncbi:hypothetical protein LEN26_017902 [Aphanomyces euteiches]|nr:hypothetical protein LEN26_017902 [Aphanomyces euteiches]